MRLDDKVAIVTGATRGVGRGVARELARQGAQVFVTGRSVPDHEPFDEPVTVIHCDHRDDSQVEAAFERITRDGATIDILVNSVWGGYAGMVEEGRVPPGPSRSGSSRCGGGTRCSRRAFARITTPASWPRARWLRSVGD